MGLFGYGKHRVVVELRKYLAGLNIPSQLGDVRGTPFLTIGVRAGVEVQLGLDNDAKNWVAEYAIYQPGNPFPQDSDLWPTLIGPTNMPFDTLMRTVTARAPASPSSR